MNFKQLLFLFFLHWAAPSLLMAQSQPDQRISMEGKTYLLHFVKNGETLSDLAATYRVTEKEIVAANPDLLFGLKPGSTIKIPEKQNDDCIEIKVKRKQTVFSIAREYEISLLDLYRYNPEARNGVEPGQILRIPLPKQALPSHEQVPAEPLSVLADVYSPPETMLDRGFNHRVEPGETLFDLEKSYGIAADSLLAINPVLRNGLVPGMMIRVPLVNLPRVSVVPENENEFIRYRVKADENIYGLAEHFHLSVAEVKAANPILKYRDMMDGEELLIPDKSLRYKVWNEASGDSVWAYPDYRLVKASQPRAVTCKAEGRNDENEYRVALLLPLFLDANDTINRIPLTPDDLMADSLFMSTYQEGMALPTDSFRIRDEKIIDPRSENFMHLYEGVLMAADSLRRQGMNLQLFVYDTNRDSLVIDSLIRHNALLGMNLIIGPVYPDLQEPVSAFSREHQIPMVSPLAASGHFEHNNPFYFKVSPDKEYLIKETAKLITDDYYNKNFIVLKMGDYQHLDEALLVDQCQKRLFSTGYYDQANDQLFCEYDFNDGGIWGLQHIVSHKRENVFIIPAVNEGQMSIAVTNLNTLSEEADVRLVGLSNFKNFRSIQTEYFHHTQLQYYTHYYVDYQNTMVNRFIASFKERFGAEPNEFSFQGFDVAYYFMSALHQLGRDFVPCIPAFNMKLNQLNLCFRRVSDKGGFMNYGLFDLTYQKDYTIKNRGTYAPVFIPLKTTNE